MKNKIKSDKFKKARGGHTKMLVLSCAKCGQYLFDYQKDGIGSLKRTYLDRIYNSHELVNLQYLEFEKVPQLFCPKCKEHLGTPMVYKKENRTAFRLIPGKVKKN